MQNCAPTTMTIKKDPDYTANRPHTDHLESFKCATSEPELYECQGCSNFQTNLFVHLQQHIRQNHTHPNAKPFKLYQCPNCDYQTYSNYLAIRHRLFVCCGLKSDDEQNHNEWYRCEECIFVTKQKSSLRVHKLKHSPEWKDCVKQHEISGQVVDGKWYQCGHCTYECGLLSRLQQHQKLKHRCWQLEYHILEKAVNSKTIKWFQCGQCSFQSRASGDLRRHNLNLHGLMNASDLFDCAKGISERYSCTKCDNFTSDLWTLMKKHVSEGHTDLKREEYKVYKCKKCDFTTYSRYLDLRHGLFYDCVVEDQARLSDSEDETEIRSWKRRSKIRRITDTDDETTFRFACKQCPFKTDKIGPFNQHMVYHAKRSFRCNYCTFKGSTRLELQTHIVQHMNDDDILYYQCAHCPFKTPLKVNLRKHVQKHAPHWIQCAKCSFKTKYTYNMKLHEKAKHQVVVKWFDCDLCDFRSKRLYNLKLHKIVRHATVHSSTTDADNATTDGCGEKWYHCDRCTFKTKVKSSVRSHQQVHSEKRYKCKYCEHTSKRMFNLKTHILQKHEDPKNIQWLHCEECDFKSKTKSILMRHVKERHSNEWVYCAQCSFKAKSKRLLISHLRMVHNSGKEVTLLQCDHCPYMAKTKSSIWHHNKWKHGSRKVAVKENE